MRNTNNLKVAKRAKNDEFYTRYEDIEKEIKHYTQHFNNKVIYCNCDDYNKSNFFKYFKDNFNQFKLKKLITTSYINNGKGLYSEYDGKTLITGELKSNGSFKSEESIEYLKQSDIIVTNPPFSLFREYVDVLFTFNKKFIIIGNQNAITYIDVFKHIKDGEVWLSHSINVDIFYFIVPSDFEVTNDRVIEENGKRLKQVNGVCWFTNIENNKELDAISLIKEYNEIDYPIYDNYNAINVNFIKDMPYDYDGVIGVPITALKYLCSDGLLHFDTPMREREKSIQDCWCDDYYKSDRGQFWLSIHQWKEDICKSTHSIYKIIKFRKGDDDKDLSINGKTPYFRILIQRIN